MPRLGCERRGRITDDTHYGFEVRNSRLWTESEKLNERFKVTVSPFQDDNWLRQLFAPTFIDWLGESSPGDFSFELAYGSLLCSVEADDPGAGRAGGALGGGRDGGEADPRRVEGVATMQINRTGYWLLAFFGIGGLIFTLLDFFVFPFPILIGPIWLLVVVGLVIYAIRQARRGATSNGCGGRGSGARGRWSRRAAGR